MPRIRHKSLDCSPGCVVEGALALIGGKWKGVVLYHLLQEKVLRFNEIRRRLPNVTPRMLTAQLRELEADGFVERKVYPEVPPKVEYRLTRHGMSLAPVIAALKAWGDAHIDLEARVKPSAKKKAA
ncbi:winged helix-turn-helix transcriptional regulator [Xanthobacter autotrophicus]|uniref:winged helix-turn-helix transcriptional regulator n=1 Tax=Xanthobacter autotrophicus TaxID=280 RepID=UPI00372A1545